MIPILIALASCAEYFESEYESGYDSEFAENGWGKKLKRAAKKVTKPVRKATKAVTKPIKKATKVVTKPVTKLTKSISRFVYDTKHSEWTEPIKITSLTKETGENVYNTENLDTMVATIAKENNVDSSKLTNFFKKARFAKTSKTLLNMINFGAKKDMRYRVASLGTAAVKVVKEGSNYAITVKKAIASANIWANTVSKSTKKVMGSSSSKTRKNWRPLTSAELTGVYNNCQQEINTELNAMRAI